MSLKNETREKLKDKIREIFIAGDDPAATVYSVFWTDGPAGFNGLKTLRDENSNAVRIIYAKENTDDGPELSANITGGKKTRDSARDLFDGLMSAVDTATDAEQDEKVDAETLSPLLDALKNIGAELMVDFIGTDEKFDGGGILYNFSLGRDGVVHIIGTHAEQSKERREDFDEFYIGVLKDGDPFAYGRLCEQAGAEMKEKDPPLYSLYWTATDNPIDALRKITEPGMNVARVEFTGKGKEIKDSRVAAGSPVREAAAAVLFGIVDLVPGAEAMPRVQIDDDGRDLILKTFKDRGVVKMIDLLGGADFNTGDDVYVFEISRGGLVGIGKASGPGAASFKRDLAAVYKQITKKADARNWTPEVINPTKERSKK